MSNESIPKKKDDNKEVSTITIFGKKYHITQVKPPYFGRWFITKSSGDKSCLSLNLTSDHIKNLRLVADAPYSKPIIFDEEEDANQYITDTLKGTPVKTEAALIGNKRIAESAYLLTPIKV